MVGRVQVQFLLGKESLMAEVFGDPFRVRIVLLLEEWFYSFSFDWKIVLFERRYHLICWIRRFHSHSCWCGRNHRPRSRVNKAKQRWSEDQKALIAYFNMH